MQGSAVGQTLGAPIVAALVTQAGGDWGVAIWPMLVMSGVFSYWDILGFADQICRSDC